MTETAVAEAEAKASTPQNGSASAVILRVKELVTAVDALLGSKSMQSIGRLIQQLGIGELVGRCVSGLRDITTSLRSLVSGLRRAADEKDGLSGLLGLLRPLVAGLGALTTASASELEDVGLGSLSPALGPVGEAMKKSERWLSNGTVLLDRIPSAVEVVRLGEAVERLIGSLNQLVTVLQNPSSADASKAPTGAALGALGAQSSKQTPPAQAATNTEPSSKREPASQPHKLPAQLPPDRPSSATTNPKGRQQ